MNNCEAILFDLDGTLIDTWEDLMLSANYVLKKYGYNELNQDTARLLATDGMIKLLSSSMGKDINKYDLEELKQEFLNYYINHICVKSKPFKGILELLDYCRTNNIIWGIVTNKPSFLTQPLINSFQELSDCAVIVCSDTIKEKKPDPRPITYALEQINKKSQYVVYVGDHIRDIQCGSNAGTTTIAASWGYINQNDDIKKWDADYICKEPIDIIKIIEQ